MDHLPQSSASEDECHHKLSDPIIELQKLNQMIEEANSVSTHEDITNTMTSLESVLSPLSLLSERNNDRNGHTFGNGNKMLNDLLDKPIDGNQRNDETSSVKRKSIDNDHDIEEEDDDDDEDDDDNDDVKDEIHDDGHGDGHKRILSDDDDAHDSSMVNECGDMNKSKKMKTSPKVLTKSSPSKSKGKKIKGKSKASHLRRNIKPILEVKDLENETIAARKDEEERQLRQWERAHQRNASIGSTSANTSLNMPLLNQPFDMSQFDLGIDAADQLFESPSESKTNLKPLDEVFLLSDDDDDDNHDDKSKPSHSKSLQNHMFNSQYTGATAEVIDLSSGDEESGDGYKNNNNYKKFDPFPNLYAYGGDPNILIDSNMVGAHDDDDILIVGELQNENNYEDFNNCGNHTDDTLNTFDENRRVLVNVGHPQEDDDIFFAPNLAESIKPHQIGGIRFMYDNCVDSMERFKNTPGFGCILSHSMGLGKTMQIIVFVDILLTHTTAKYILCIVPINTLQNWIGEFNKWLPEKSDDSNIRTRTFELYALIDAKSVTDRCKEILKWRKTGGVLLLGYEMYRILTSPQIKKKSDYDKSLDEIYSDIYNSIVDPGPDLVVCDEGHRIKNCNAATSLALKNIRTKRRIVLTGYPLQNNLIEYWCMVDFVRPNYLGSKKEFINMFERPIANGQCTDSTPHDKKIMRYRAHVLHRLLQGFVQRRSHSILKQTLPSKYEHVILCRMSPIQKQLMLAFLDSVIQTNATNDSTGNKWSAILLFAVMCKIWNHPDIIFEMMEKGKSPDDLDIDLPSQSKKNTKKSGAALKNVPNLRKKKSKLSAASSSSSTTTPTVTSEPSYLNSLNSFIDNTQLTPQSSQCSTIASPFNHRSQNNVIDYSWVKPILSNYVSGDITNSMKMVILFEIIEETISQGDRLLVFSQSLFTLDIIERFLCTRHVPNTNDFWCKYKNYYRLDGSTSSQERDKYINKFNNKRNAYLFLLSTRAGSLGINLFGANRIVVFDASWNPCHDAQAACRIYRYGQEKCCHIYRLICDNSLEKKIYDRQVNKQGMADRVVDEINVDSHFTWREIHSLVDDLHHISEPAIQIFSQQQLNRYKDDLIKHICIKLNNCITRPPFEHESLLLDRKETKLTTAEKRIAEDLYRMDKNRNNLNNAGFINNRGAIGSVLTPQLSHNPYIPQSSILPSQITPMPANHTPSFMPMFGQQSVPYTQHLPANVHSRSMNVPMGPSNVPMVHVQDSLFHDFNTVTGTLIRNGLMMKKIQLHEDLVLDTTDNNGQVILKKDDDIILIKTPKGMYLRTSDHRYIAIENSGLNMSSANTVNPNTLQSFIQPIVQPNLHCGGSVYFPSSSSNRFHLQSSATITDPLVVDLIDDNDDDTPPFDVQSAAEDPSFASSLNGDSNISVESFGCDMQTDNNSIDPFASLVSESSLPIEASNMNAAANGSSVQLFDII